MKRWNFVVLAGSLFFGGCMLEDMGLDPSSTTNPGSTGGGAGQGGGGQGGQGGQGSSVECTMASECPAASGPCAIAACTNGQCQEVAGNAGVTCRAAVSNCDIAEVCDGQNVACPGNVVAAVGTACREATNACDAIEVCDGVSGECAPDTGAAALCESVLPITYMANERTFTMTSVNLAGTGQTIATVNPGAQVNLQFTGNWKQQNMPTCPACITQFYLAIEGQSLACLNTSPASGMFNQNITFMAPQAPGIYIINPAATWQNGCVPVMVSPDFGASSIATLVVQ